MFQIILESSWNSGESGIRFGGASREARGDMCSTTQGGQPSGSIRSLWLRLRLEGLIGEKDDSASMVEGNFAKEPPDSLNDAAESSGDRRLSIGGNADRKSPARQKINLESRAEEEAFTLNFYRRGREGAIRKGEERRVVLVVIRNRCISSSSSSSSI